MNDQELLEFTYLLFGVGIVMLVYYPNLFTALLPYVALLGAFYFVWGIISRLTGGLLGVHFARRNDWWNGIVILTVIILVYGQKNTAIASIYAIINIIWSIFTGVFSLIHV
ncbi:MAG: hypothetical protein J7K68_00720 [Candidatus Diapherotrites archaeon]|nr:hypothetical protein [Candidatus Diapherotrites archaeon]